MRRVLIAAALLAGIACARAAFEVSTLVGDGYHRMLNLRVSDFEGVTLHDVVHAQLNFSSSWFVDVHEVMSSWGESASLKWSCGNDLVEAPTTFYVNKTIPDVIDIEAPEYARTIVPKTQSLLLTVNAPAGSRGCELTALRLSMPVHARYLAPHSESPSSNARRGRLLGNATVAACMDLTLEFDEFYRRVEVQNDCPQIPVGEDGELYSVFWLTLGTAFSGAVVIALAACWP